MRARKPFLVALWIAGLLALVAGCRLGSGPVRPTPKAGDANTKLVAQVADIVGEQRWHRSGYWRIDDAPGWPWTIVIATDGTGCPTFQQEVYTPMPGDYYTCKIAWRLRRSV